MTQATEVPRSDPPKNGDELATLCGFLDYLREAVVLKATGLDDEVLRRPMVPSGVCLLGIVKHLAYMERWWFAHVFKGLDEQFPWTDEDRDAEWRIEPDDSTEAVLELYRVECERSRAIVAEAKAPDQASVKLSERTREPFSLRWVVAHMIEETGRHAGHADILRELIDGSTGE